MPITGRSPAVTVPQLPGTGLSLTSGNFVGGRIYAGGGQSIPAGVWTTLTLPSLEYDIGPNVTGANFVQSGHSNALVAFATGVYSVAASVDAGSAPVSVRPVSGSGNFGYSGTPSGPFGNDYADAGVLSAGDVVTLQVYAPSGATVVHARLALTLLVSVSVALVQVTQAYEWLITNNMTMTFAKAPTPGNMLFSWVSTQGNPQYLPTGWTAIGAPAQTTNGYSITATLAYRVAQAGDLSWVWPNSGTQMTGIMCEVSGVTGTPVGSATATNASGTPEVVGPAAAPSGAPGIGLVGLAWAGYSVPSWANPAGYTTVEFLAPPTSYPPPTMWLGFQTMLSAPSSFTASIPVPGGPNYAGVAGTFRVIL